MEHHVQTADTGQNTVIINRTAANACLRGRVKCKKIYRKWWNEHFSLQPHLSVSEGDSERPIRSDLCLSIKVNDCWKRQTLQTVKHKPSLYT